MMDLSRICRRVGRVALAIGLLAMPTAARAQRILIPMDDGQTNHLQRGIVPLARARVAPREHH